MNLADLRRQGVVQLKMDIQRKKCNAKLRQKLIETVEEITKMIELSDKSIRKLYAHYAQRFKKGRYKKK